jgi:hypothetical protein
MYLHTLPTLKERTKDAQIKLSAFLSRELKEAEDKTVFCLEADICTNVLFAYAYETEFAKYYHFDILETSQTNAGVFTRVSCSLKAQTH